MKLYWQSINHYIVECEANVIPQNLLFVPLGQSHPYSPEYKLSGFRVEPRRSYRDDVRRWDVYLTYN